VQILFCPHKPVRTATIQEIYDQIEGENLSRLILILKGKILSKARDFMKDKFTFKVEFFWVSFFIVVDGLF
jgi:hypothetical protein